jgi:hypothetical protein
MRERDAFVRKYEAEVGTISISPAHYHGSALAGVDRQIRLSNNGIHHEMMDGSSEQLRISARK